MTSIEIFCCSARNDHVLLESLKTHLAFLESQGLITVSSDVDINAGEEWKKGIDSHLNTADIILLLISSSFMASPYCYNYEMVRAMERHDLKKARVIPIIMRSVYWEDAPFSKLMVLPTNGLPVTNKVYWPSLDEALVDVVKNIRMVVNDICVERYMIEADNLCKDPKGPEDSKGPHYAEAIGIYKKVLALQPNNVLALLGKGKAQLHLGMYEDSILTFNDGLRVAASDDKAHFYEGKAQALSHLDRYEESLAAYDDAIKCNNQDAQLYNGKVGVLLLLKKYNEALKQINEAIRLAEMQACYYQKKGDIFAELNEYKQAIEAYELAIQRDPFDVYSYEKKGDLLLNLRKDEEALAAYNEAIRLAPTPMYYLKRSILLLRLQRNEEVLKADEEAIRLAATEPFYHYSKGIALFRLQRNEEALVAYNKAIELSAQNADPQFYHDRAVVYERLAEQSYKEAGRIRSNRWSDRTIAPPSLLSLLSVKPEAFTLQHTLNEHTDEVWEVVFSPNGNLLASRSKDRFIKLWDVQTGKCLHTLNEHIEDVWEVLFSPDGNLLASRSKDRFIKLWDVQTGKLRYNLDLHEEETHQFLFSPDGKLLASHNNYDRTIRLWDVQTGKLRYNLEHDNDVWDILFSPDGHLLASRSMDRTIKLWNVHTGERLDTLGKYTTGVWEILFRPDGKQLVSRSDNGIISVYNLQAGKLLYSFSKDNENVQKLAFSPPNGKYLATCSVNRLIKLWNSDTGEWQNTFNDLTGTLLKEPFKADNNNKFFFSPDGQLLACSSVNWIRLWNVRTSADVLQEDMPCSGELFFSPDEKLLARRGENNTLKLWNTRTGELLHVFSPHEAAISSIAFSPDSKLLASASNDKTIKLWRIPDEIV